MTATQMPSQPAPVSERKACRVPPSPAVEAIVSNPVKTRSDVVDLLAALLAPVVAAQSPGGARVRLASGGATFDDIAADLEGFARPLWALAPALQAEPDHPILRPLGDKWAMGLDHGTNPEHAEFWGWPDERDQRFVEMAALSVAIGLVPDIFWKPQSSEAKKRIATWLLTINNHDIPTNNWRFFRVLVNVGLKIVGADYSQRSIDETLDFIDTFYGDHGFPADGPDGEIVAYDYYATSFAIPFYSLLYARMDPDAGAMVDKFFARAHANAPLAVHLFAPDGAAIAFGRSMTYRFAVAGAWAALAWASDTEVQGKYSLPAPFTWGVLKGLVLRTVRWFTQREDVFNRDGSFSIGWTYPQLFMSEQYNSPESPYWALKALFVLGLSDNHPFWTADEEPIPAEFQRNAVVKPWMQTFSHAAGHTFLLTQGQYTNWPMRQSAAKYGKMAYSAPFGFSVVAGQYGLDAFAPDSTLAFSDDGGEYWKVPRIVDDVTVSDEGVITSVWKPWPDVMVKTWLIPPPGDKPWHTRVHHIKSTRALQFSDAGFSVSHETGPDGNQRHIPVVQSVEDMFGAHGRWQDSTSAAAFSASGVSGVFDLLPEQAHRGKVVVALPSANLIEPRTVFPTILGTVEGEKWVAVRVFAIPKMDGKDPVWREEWEALKSWSSVGDMRNEYPFIQ